MLCRQRPKNRAMRASRSITPGYGLVLDANNHHISPQACWSPASGAWVRADLTPDGAEAIEDYNG
jgi:hypothetical protein